MAAANPYEQYRATQVQTASQRTLIIMLYDGAIRFSRQAQAAMAARDFEAVNTALLRAQDIVTELALTLDHGAGEIAANLFRIYEYVHRRLVEANVHKDAAPIDEVLRLLSMLREAWAEAPTARPAVTAATGAD